MKLYLKIVKNEREDYNLRLAALNCAVAAQDNPAAREIINAAAQAADERLKAKAAPFVLQEKK